MGASDPITELSLNSLGLNKISLTNWDNSSIPQVMVGSLWSVGASVFVVQDSAETITGLSGAADGLVYVYSDSTGALSVSTANAPTWDETRYGWYYSNSRCLMTILKAGASYTQKTIWMNREYGLIYSGLSVALGADADRMIRVASDATLLWDESENAFDIGSKKYRGDFDYATNNGLLLAEKTVSGSIEFYVKKPISSIFSYYSQSAGYTLTFDVYYNSGWVTIKTYTGASGNEYIALNPGRFRFTLQNSYAANYARLYGVGVFSQDTVETAEIIT